MMVSMAVLTTVSVPGAEETIAALAAPARAIATAKERIFAGWKIEEDSV